MMQAATCCLELPQSCCVHCLKQVCGALVAISISSTVAPSFHKVRTCSYKCSVCTKQTLQSHKRLLWTLLSMLVFRLCSTYSAARLSPVLMLPYCLAHATRANNQKPERKDDAVAKPAPCTSSVVMTMDDGSFMAGQVPIVCDQSISAE